MRKLGIRDAEIIKKALQREIVRSEEARYNHRLHAVLLVCAGKSCYEVADLLGHSPRTIEYWVDRFEQTGFAGLKDQKRKGRPPALDERLCCMIDKDIHSLPRDFGYEQNLWDGNLLSHHLSVKYNVQLGVRQCQRLFHTFVLYRHKPRPVIAPADPERRRPCKKTAPTGKKKEY